MKRPTCVHCGKPYGKRHTKMQTLRWPVGQERPAYRGNGVVVKEWDGYQTNDKALMQSIADRTPNPTIRAVEQRKADATPDQVEFVAQREIWDGESWFGGYDPFCTLRCALNYARHAYAQREALTRNMRDGGR